MNSALRAATDLRDTSRKLLELSLRQSEFLEQERFAALQEAAAQKDELLIELQRALAAAGRRGWSLRNSATYPADGTCAGLLREAEVVLRRLQAHEKYIAGLMTAQKLHIGERLSEIHTKRSAAVVYGTRTVHGLSVDKAL